MNDTPDNAEQTVAERSSIQGLFVVPLIIVSVVLVCAVIVVLLFGAIASSKQQPLEKLVATLESASGEKTAGLMLMPKDKELWQAAQELALRLEDRDAEIEPHQLPELQSRLTRLMSNEIDRSTQMAQTAKQRLFFIMRATAKSGAQEALPVYIEALRTSSDAEVRRECLAALALMDELGITRDQLSAVLDALEDSDPVVQMFACAAISKIARPGDVHVVSRLGRAYEVPDQDPDVRKNIALTLARLGSDRGLDVLLEMLDRQYWTSQKVRYTTADGTPVERTLSTREVESYLIASVDAAANLPNNEVWALIEAMREDRSLSVANRAKQVVSLRDH